MTFVNNYLKKVLVYFLKTNDDVFGKLKDWKTMVEKRIGKHVNIVLNDAIDRSVIMLHLIHSSREKA